MTKPTSFRLSDDNLTYLEATAADNKSEFMNNLLDKIRSQQLIEAPIVGSNPDEDGSCIYSLVAWAKDTQNIIAACPVKARIPRLKQAANFEDLLKACKACPRRQEHLILIKRQTSDKKTTIQTTEPSKELFIEYTSPPFACRTCPKQLRWSKQFKRPVEVDTELEHYCPNWKPQAKPAPLDKLPQAEHDEGITIQCSQCKFSHSTFVYDEESGERLLNVLMNHKKAAHGNDILTEQETQQMRAINDTIKQKVEAARV